jgi:phenylpropionate dioxygenase-like ring-hydroxylating dioxygenase large terminal subunit
MAETDTPDGASNTGSPWTLPPRYYTDPTIFEREKEKIFFRGWIYAGHISALQKPGDYFAFQLLEQNLFSIMGRDGTVRTFFNVCQHRAHELVEGSGTRRVLVCPYHGWAYELDGRLRKATNDSNVPAFDRSRICLTEVRTEVMAGFIFVNLDRNAPPMAETYRDVETELRHYVPLIDRLQPVRWVEIEEHCNWKVSVENYNECYHCKLNHATFARGVIDPNSYDVVPHGYSLRHKTVAADNQNMSYTFDPASNDTASAYRSYFLWPGFSFQVYPGNLLNIYLWCPVSVDKTLIYRGWLTVDGVESEMVERLADQDYTTTVAEDIRLVESVQRGLKSRGYQGGPLLIDPRGGVDSEHPVATLQGWVREAVGGAETSPP